MQQWGYTGLRANRAWCDFYVIAAKIEATAPALRQMSRDTRGGRDGVP